MRRPLRASRDGTMAKVESDPTFLLDVSPSRSSPPHHRDARVRARAVAGRAHPRAARGVVSLRAKCACSASRRRATECRTGRSPTSAARACSSRSSSSRWRTVAPISPCIRSRTCRWTCPTDSRWRRSLRTRGPARRVRVESLPRSRRPAGRRARRHVEPAPRGAAARARSAAAGPAAARQRQHAAAQARRGPLRRDHPRGRGAEAARIRRADRLAPRSGGEPAGGRAKARWPSNAAPIAATSSPRSRRSRTATRRSRRRPSARSRARCRGAATRRSPHTRCSRRGELWLRGLLASRDGARVMRGERARAVADTEAADALGRALADDFLARGAADSSRALEVARLQLPGSAHSLTEAALAQPAGPLAGCGGILVTRPARQAGGIRAEDRGARAAADHLSRDRDSAARRSRAARARACRARATTTSRSSSPPTPSNTACPIRGAGRRGSSPSRPGPGTAEALAAVGIADARIPATSFDSEGLLALPELRGVRGQAHRRSSAATAAASYWATRCRARGATVDYVACYRRARPQAARQA